ncbi:Kelch repeat-containing protein [Spongiivirga citrea]|uniref:Galactose oxidase n=1 Tax=Spongiivirga citrea TaxID=1481457 RepID=A0A6M0CGL8_9FLAO|nr:hypothetical protein [Spongiivirga citrea]NER17068.1 hypothetical protein [Spongiivirga citrea]
MKTKQLVLLSLIVIISACQKQEITEPEKLNASKLGLGATPLSLKGELINKETPFPKRAYHTSLNFDKSIWIIGGLAADVEGYENDVWRSENGKEWKLVNPDANFNGRMAHASTVHDKKMWVIGGKNGAAGQLSPNNEVWHSKDGKHWEFATKNAPFSARSAHTLTAFKGRMWLIGGEGKESSDIKKDIWVSGDGANWVLANSNPPFGKRKGHTTLVHDNKLWVIGGISYSGVSSGFSNDVWYSSDGINWNLATPDAGFKSRLGHTAVSYNKGMYVMAGHAGFANFLNDAWRSTDGINWKKVSITNEFKTRANHTSIVYDNRIWTISGFPVISYPIKNGVYTEGFHSDVWAFQ